MAKKKTGLSQTLFQEIDPYGEGADAPTAPHLLPLGAVRPDPGQPRRVLPRSLTEAVTTGEMTPLAAMRTWMEDVDGDSGAPALTALRRLASSIERHGLINPLTVRQPRPGENVGPGVTHLIVTGERRYWAHVLLALEGRSVHSGETVREPTQVPVYVTAKGITVRAHQLIENIMREDINAVEKARGLVALRYELSKVNDSSPAIGRDDAEVNDSSPPPELVPWARVSEELGISKRYRIFITSVLNLSTGAQQIVMEHDLAETTIRPIVQKLRDDPELQVAALQQLVTWQRENEAGEGENRAITRAVQALVAELLAQKQSQSAQRAVADAADIVDQEAQTRRFRRRVRNTLRFLQRLPDEERTLVARDLALDKNYAEVADELRELRLQLDAILDRVAAYRETNS